MSPHNGPLMELCIVKKDLIMAAHVQYDLLNAGLATGDMQLEQEASYCFVQGHCKNTEVTAQTTVEEAEAICDKKVGHKTWTTWGSVQTKIKPGNIPREDKPYSDSKQTSSLLAGSCAMGSYHCEVMMCKETFCKEPQYIEKYGHLEPKTVNAWGWPSANP